MTTKEALKFEELPKIGDEPLTGMDIVSMMRWSVEQKRNRRRISNALKVSGESLDAMWKEQPETLLGDLDNPSLTLFKPESVYAISADFGLKTAQLAAFDHVYGQRVQDLSDNLTDHLVSQNVTISAWAGTDLPPTIYKAEHEGRAWTKILDYANGYVVHANVGRAAIWLRSPQGLGDFAISLNDQVLNQNDMAQGFQMNLHY